MEPTLFWSGPARIQAPSNTGATRNSRLGHPWEINGIRTGRLKFVTMIAATTLTATALLAPALVQTAESKPKLGLSCGGASWYALRSRTASGEMMNPAAMTAAHKTLPLGSKVKVTNLRNGKAVIVRINDRGPFIKGRLIDLSRGAASKLGFIGAGHTRVQIEPADGSVTQDCA